MIEIPQQIQLDHSMVPASAEAMELIREYKPNQIVRCKITGMRKERSLRQLNTFMACCQYVADNVREYDLGHPKFKDGAYWNTKSKAAFQIKVALHFVDDSKTIVYQDRVVFHYRSISFRNLHHLEACFFFDRGFPLLAARIGMKERGLIRAAQELMGRIA